MKAIILVLLGLIALSSAAHLKHKTHARTHLQLRQVNPDDLSDDAQDSLRYGIETVIAAARKSGKVDATDVWTIEDVLTATETLNGKNAVNHIFRVVLTDGDDSILTADFSVNYVSFSGYRSLNSYKYQVKNTRVTGAPTPAGPWVEVDLASDLGVDSLIQDVVNDVILKGNGDNKIPDGTYWALDYTLHSQAMTSGTTYTGSVSLHNGQTVEVTVNFTVYVDPNGKRTVTKSSFKATGVPKKAQYEHDIGLNWFQHSFTAVA